jgi:hypothetical protein
VFPENFAQSGSQKIRFPASCPDDVSYHPDAQLSKSPAVQMTCHTIRTHIRLKHHPSGRRGFPFGPSSVSRSFELLQLAPFRTIQQPVRTTLSVRPKLQDFFPKHRYGKIAETVQTTWILVQMRSSIKQVSQFKSRGPDASQHGPDTRASDMKIACITSTVGTTILLVRTRETSIWKLLAAGRATVRTTGQHRPDVGLKQERYSAKFSKFRSHSCPSGRPMTTFRTGPSFIKPDAHLNCQPINRGL